MKGKIPYSIIKSIPISSLQTVQVGKHVGIGKGSIIRGKVKIGDYSFGGANCCFDGSDEGLIIGKYCSIAGNVSLLGYNNHNYTKLTTYSPYALQIPITGSDDVGGVIKIGHDVRIGANAVILPNVQIGTGAVIGASSVVTKEIPPYAIAVGNPAKVIKYRFDNKTIEKLLKSEWWNWKIETIRKNYNLESIKHLGKESHTRECPVTESLQEISFKDF